MNKVLPHEDEFPELDEEFSDEDDEESASVLLGDQELIGTRDAEELMLSEIDEGPESIGLDVETGTNDRSDGFTDGTAELQDSDEGEAGSWTLDEVGIDVDAELELDEEDEDGWTAESEGTQGPWDDELGLDDDETDTDDGGLEGVEDPALDELGLEDAEPTRGHDDDEDEAEEEFDEELPLTPYAQSVGRK